MRTRSRWAARSYLASLATLLTFLGCHPKHATPIDAAPPAPDAALALEAKTRDDAIARFTASVNAVPAYGTLWEEKNESTLNAFLTILARALETAHPGEGGVTSEIEETTVKPLERAKLVDPALDLAQLAMQDALPPEFAKAFKTHLEATKERPHFGLWAPAAKPRAAFDYSALAVFLEHENGQYLRELLAARDQTAGVSAWSSTKSALYPWLADELAALTKLSTFGPRLMGWQSLARLRELNGTAGRDSATDGSGTAEATTPANDGGDISTRCSELKKQFDVASRVAVLNCESPFKPLDHAIIRVTVGESGWSAGDASIRAIVVAAALDRFKGHWSAYHHVDVGNQGLANRVEVIGSSSGKVLARLFLDGRR